MKIFIFTFLFTTAAYSQTVTKVNGINIQISGAEVADLKVDEEVQFLNEELDIVGLGSIAKISSGGKTALVKLKSGRTTAGNTIESNRPRTGTDKKNLVRPSDRENNRSQLSESDRELLSRGPISTERYVIGGILGTYPFGLGIGHAVQGRYLEKGWVFTVGQLASGAVMIAGLSNCVWSTMARANGCDNGLFALGVAGYVGFRIWEIIDVWAVPPEQNRRYHELRRRIGEPSYSIRPAIIPTADGGALLGMNISF